jgi:hypothetical protein
MLKQLHGTSASTAAPGEVEPEVGSIVGAAARAGAVIAPVFQSDGCAACKRAASD